MGIIDWEERNGYPSSPNKFGVKSITREADYIGHGKWKIPPGYGEYSGRIIDNSTFTFVVPINHHEVRFNDMDSDRDYNFLNDREFAEKFKAFYSNRETYRRMGRTRLLAKTLIELSIESGREVELIDDHAQIFLSKTGYNRDVQRHLAREIQDVVYEMQMHLRHIDIIRLDDRYVHVRCYDMPGYEAYRIGTFTPAIKETGNGFISMIEEKEQDDELLLICEI